MSLTWTLVEACGAFEVDLGYASVAFPLTEEKLRQQSGVFVRQPVKSGFGDEEEEKEEEGDP